MGDRGREGAGQFPGACCAARHLTNSAVLKGSLKYRQDGAHFTDEQAEAQRRDMAFPGPPSSLADDETDIALPPATEKPGFSIPWFQSLAFSAQE